MCKVSICIPAYGNPEGIRRLLDSIAGQTYTDFEIIITDDSPDDSVKKIVEAEELQAEANGAGTKIYFEQKLKYHKNPQRLGASENWNHSIELANGEYIKMMHHDDWFTDQDSLKQFVDMLDSNPNAILAFSGSRQVDLDKLPYTTGTQTESVTIKNDQSNLENGVLCNRNISQKSTVFYDRHISPEDAEELANDIYYLYISQCIGAPSATIYRKNSLKYDGELTWLMDAEYYMHLMQVASIVPVTTTTSIDADAPCNITPCNVTPIKTVHESDTTSELDVVPEKRRKNVFAYTTSPLVSIGTSSTQLTEAVGQDGEINVFEYGYIMNEFDLGNPDNELLETPKLSSADNAYRYRNKLITKAVEFKQPYEKIEQYAIPKDEYKKAKKKKRKENILFYINLVFRKLFKS